MDSKFYSSSSASDWTLILGTRPGERVKPWGVLSLENLDKTGTWRHIQDTDSDARVKEQPSKLNTGRQHWVAASRGREKPSGRC